MTKNSVLKHKREQASWLKILLLEQLTAKDIYLYGSVGKLGSFEGDDLAIFDENSDYDYAVQDSVKVAGELRALGWEEKQNLAYQDSMTVKVFEGRLDGERVQVSLRNNLPLFKEVWSSVPCEFYWRFLNKRAPMFIGGEGVKTYLDQIAYVAQGNYKQTAKARFEVGNDPWGRGRLADWVIFDEVAGL